jgi:hypothetical protein
MGGSSSSGFVLGDRDCPRPRTQLTRAHTAIVITWDEGGGYYDSGYIQPLDFFGDGPRIPLIIVSRYTRGGHVNHTYTDHVSILKFIERNWGLKPLTVRSRDNFPNPTTNAMNPYVPTNSPAIGTCSTCSISLAVTSIEVALADQKDDRPSWVIIRGILSRGILSRAFS